MRTPLCAFLAFAMIAGSASPQTPARHTFVISYSAHARGVEAGHVDYSFSFDGGGYRGASQRRLSGLARVFFGASQDFDYSVQGTIDDHGVVRPLFYQHQDFGKRHRLVRVMFNGDEVTTVATPPMGMGHPAATHDQKADTIDQVSMLARMLLTRGDPCRQTYRVFMDGRSRFDLVLTSAGAGNVALPGYHGPVVRCRVAFQPIAGFSDPQAPAQLTFLFARVGDCVVPVSIEMPTDAAGIVQLQVRRYTLN